MKETVFKFKYSEKDFQEFNHFFVFGKRSFKVINGILILLLVTIIFVFALNRTVDTYLLFTLIFLATFTYILLPLILRISTAKAYKSNKYLQKEMTYKINDEGITQISDTGSFTYKWQDLYSASESKTAIYVFISGTQALLLPKEKIDADELKEKLRSVIDPKLLKLK